MDKEIYSTIKKYLSLVAQQEPGYITAYLFGSFARDIQHSGSDIDLAIILENLNDSERFDKQVKLMLLATLFDSRIEPHPFSKDDLKSSDPFLHEIKKTGIEMQIEDT